MLRDALHWFRTNLPPRWPPVLEAQESDVIEVFEEIGRLDAEHQAQLIKQS